MAASNKSWKPRFSVLGFISGALWGVGGIVLLQQSGRFALTAGQLSKALISAFLLGVIVPTAIRWFVINRPRQIAASAAAIIVATMGLAAFASPQPAAAQTCSLVVNAQTVSAGTVVKVAESDNLTVGFTGNNVTAGSATVKYGPFNVYNNSFTLDEPKSGPEERSFDRKQIADRGVGMYEVDAVVNTSDGDCNFDFFIDVEGDPLGSPAGQGAAALVGVGILGSLASIGREIASALAQLRATIK